MKTRIIKHSILTLATISLVGCGSMLDFNKGEEADGQGATVVPPEGSELVEVTVNLEEDTSAFNLIAAATAYSITIDSCASGHTATGSDTSSALEAYKFDQGCLAKLTGFTANGIVYIPATDFTTWAVSDTAVFEESGNPANTISVEVTEQLASPISGTENVTYTFSEIVLGADSVILEATVADSHTMTVNGQGAPNFTIGSIAFSNMTAGGAGQFDLVLNCANLQTGTGATTACDDVDLVNLTYQLVEDTYSGTMTIGEATALFPAGETAVNTGVDIHTSGNGGFNITGITGPAQMALKPNMILIMQAADLSYTYYNIDVTTITQDL